MKSNHKGIFEVESTWLDDVLEGRCQVKPRRYIELMVTLKDCLKVLRLVAIETGKTAILSPLLQSPQETLLSQNALELLGIKLDYKPTSRTLSYHLSQSTL